MNNSFFSKKSQVRYTAITLTTFLIFTTGACLSFLSSVMSTVGFDTAETGLMIASGAIPVVLFSLLAGKLLGKHSAKIVVALGVILFFIGYASLTWTSQSSIGVAPYFSLAILLGGLGLFMPGAFLMVRSSIKPEYLLKFVGIYGAMQLLPSIFGPMWAQSVFSSYGIDWYFLITGSPALLGLLVLSFAKDEVTEQPQLVSAKAAEVGFLDYLSQPGTYLPCLGGIVSGSIFGAVNIFVVLILLDAGVQIHYFFIPFVTFYLITRFFLLGMFSEVPKAIMTSGGIALMSAGVSILWLFTPTEISTSFSAIVFGLGFSITYPVLSVWISSNYEPEQSVKPISLFNALYTFGMYSSPLAAGLLLKMGGTEYFYICILGVGIFTSVFIYISRNSIVPFSTNSNTG